MKTWTVVDSLGQSHEITDEDYRIRDDGGVIFLGGSGAYFSRPISVTEKKDRTVKKKEEKS